MFLNITVNSTIFLHHPWILLSMLINNPLGRVKEWRTLEMKIAQVSFSLVEYVSHQYFHVLILFLRRSVFTYVHSHGAFPHLTHMCTRSPQEALHFLIPEPVWLGSKPTWVWHVRLRICVRLPRCPSLGSHIEELSIVLKDGKSSQESFHFEFSDVDV